MNINLEIGFRFLPPDEQIIGFFLRNKLLGNHDCTRYISEVDLTKHEPEELPEKSIVKSTYQEWFFFYKLNKISEKKIDRLTKNGYWKSTGKDRDISYGGRVIGSKKTLVFYTGRTPYGVKTDWVLHEFRASPNFIPSEAENNYVIGYLRKNAAENTESLIASNVQPSTPFSASSAQRTEVGNGSTPVKVAAQLQSNSLDYQVAWQAQLEDEGMFGYEVAPSGANTRHDLSWYEEGLSMGELDLLTSNDFVDEEQNLWQVEYDSDAIEKEMDFMASTFPNRGAIVEYDSDSTEQEMDFMASTFPNRDELSYTENQCSVFPDYRQPNYSGYSSDSKLEWANTLDVAAEHGHLGGFNEKRMENGISRDDILMMNVSAASATVTAHEINSLELVEKERSINSRSSKSQYEPRSNISVKQGHPRNIELQCNSLGKTVSSNKTRESSTHGPKVELSRNKESLLQSNKGRKMDRDSNTKSGNDSRSKGSAGSGRKSSFYFVETSQLSSEPDPAFVLLRNIILGVIVIIVVLWELLSLHLVKILILSILSILLWHGT